MTLEPKKSGVFWEFTSGDLGIVGNETCAIGMRRKIRSSERGKGGRAWMELIRELGGLKMV